jgi:hypothetical protein
MSPRSCPCYSSIAEKYEYFHKTIQASLRNDITAEGLYIDGNLKIKTKKERNTMADKQNELRLIRMNEVEATEIDWLWYPYIPYGKITVIQGDPGDGKTTAVLAVAAAVTTGAALPESKTTAEPMSVIFQTAEDGLGDTVKPRLVQSGADCGRIIVIDESEKELSLSDLRIEQAITLTGAKLFILDPSLQSRSFRSDLHLRFIRHRRRLAPVPLERPTGRGSAVPRRDERPGNAKRTGWSVPKIPLCGGVDAKRTGWSVPNTVKHT